MKTARDLAYAELWQRPWSARSRVQAAHPQLARAAPTSSPNPISFAPTSSANRRCTSSYAAPRPRGAPRWRCPGRESSSAVREGIGELASNSVQIGAIVQTIAGIAAQTNLPALNAAIDAARAEERGEGFAAVVEQSSESTEQVSACTEGTAGSCGRRSPRAAKAPSASGEARNRLVAGFTVAAMGPPHPGIVPRSQANRRGSNSEE